MNVIKIAQYRNNNGIGHDNGITAKKTIDTANQRKVILLTNKNFDQRLVKTDTWKLEEEVYSAWTGTQVAYTEKNKKVDKFIEYTDYETKIKYVFEPGEAKGEKNVILAINHGFTQDGKPFITYNKDGENKVLVQIAKEAKVDIVPNFPTSNYWYLTESKFGIPVGEMVDSSNYGARNLWRLDKGYVGLLARDGYFRRVVDVGSRPSRGFGVLGINARTPAEIQTEIKKIIGDMNANATDYKKLGELAKQLDAVLQYR